MNDKAALRIAREVKTVYETSYNNDGKGFLVFKPHEYMSERLKSFVNDFWKTLPGNKSFNEAFILLYNNIFNK